MNKFDNFKTQKAYELDYLIAQKAYELDCLRSYRDIIDHHYVKNAILHVCPELCDNEGIEEMTREEAEEYIRECLAFDDEDATKIIKTLEQQHCEDVGELSDGYHTFNQLYHQRAVLFVCIVKQNKSKAWKSFKHSDGKYCFDSNGEWFIVGVDTPQGSYTYHYAKEYWDIFDCQELECGKEWDGHTEEDVNRFL